MNIEGSKTITNYEDDSGTYYEDDGYIPNHFILEDGELKPERRRNENWKTKDRD